MEQQKPLRVILVEDEALIRMTLRFMLEDMGCSIVAETSYGEDVRALCEQQRPDAVFMDIRLRGAMDGIDAARQVNGAGNAVIVFMSAFDYEERIRGSDLENVAAFVNKPFLEENIQTVLPVVRSIRERQ